MRERLTAAFVVLTVTLLLGVLLVRTYTTDARLRAYESDQVNAQAETMAAFLSLRMDAGLPITEDVLEGVVGTDQRIEYDAVGQPPVVVEGDSFDEGNDGQDFGAVVEIPEHDATLVLLESDELLDDLVGDERGSIALVLLLVAIMAAMVGYLIAKLLAAPFLKLAVAAEQLGRGRFDLELPRTRVPEARAIGQALQTSAGQLQERLASEEAFAQHASHVLRTPLTGLRLDLEDLSMRKDLPEDVRATMAHAVVRIDAMDEVAGELVALSRSNSLVAGADIALRDLGTQCAQSWADALGPYDRALTAAVEGEIDTRYTPGPDRVRPGHPAHRRDQAQRRRGPADVPRRRGGPPHHRRHLGRRGAHRPRRRPGARQGPRRHHRARRAPQGHRRRRRGADDLPAAALTRLRASPGAVIPGGAPVPGSSTDRLDGSSAPA